MADSIIKIGGRDVRMAARASNAFFFRRVFGDDPLVLLSKATDDENSALSVDFATRMAYIMKMMAECDCDGETMAKAVSLGDFLVWVDTFSVFDFAEAAADIITLYMSQGKTHSAEKKRDD